MKVKGSRILYKDVKTNKKANQLVRKLEKKGLNAAYTDADSISGKRRGLSVYVVARKRMMKGFKVKRIPMSYL